MIFGGWTGVTNNKVYNSTDGKTWDLVNAHADWPSRHAGGYVVFKDKMWVISGDGNKDVWYSEDGKSWTCANSDAPWGARYSPYVAVFKNKLWLIGGQRNSPDGWQSNDPYYNVTGYNDVWSSEDGINWKLELKNAPWPPRALIHGNAIFKDKIWILGGGLKGPFPYQGGAETIIDYNDVWSSSDGINWEKITDNAEWKARSHFSVTTFNDMLFITDGSVNTQSNLSNEVWFSLDGKNWKELPGTLWPARHASRLISFNDNLFIINGLMHNDVWRMSKEDFINFIR